MTSINAEASSSTSPVTVSVAASRNGRTPGKAHKSEKTAVKRSYISNSVKTPFEKRREQDKAKAAMKAVEQELKDDKQADHDRKVSIIKERRERAAEKQRMEDMRAKMSAKKLQRMKKAS
uniref:rRNA-processing protein n=1 Tax=Kwoniella dejecticola CBS 10117 TaxID=1296121 RepID=A0A1A5ZXS8_9TREE|nr:rRNA-processing protein CGR1 [Kwoniella dejecticola CBS 10117]OBR82616.1 rRNA-processing protein CGR1 [Kwoniella dejecticola CBS 10117]